MKLETQEKISKLMIVQAEKLGLAIKALKAAKQAKTQQEVVEIVEIALKEMAKYGENIKDLRLI